MCYCMVVCHLLIHAVAKLEPGPLTPHDLTYMLSIFDLVNRPESVIERLELRSKRV